VVQYFSDEQGKVLTYNNRCADLIAKTASLNSAIEEWNKRGREHFALAIHLPIKALWGYMGAPPKVGPPVKAAT